MMQAIFNNDLAPRSDDEKRGQGISWAILHDAFPLALGDNATVISGPPRGGVVKSRKPSLINIQNNTHRQSSRPIKDSKTLDDKLISRAVFDATLNLDDADLKPIVHFTEGLTCHFSEIFIGILRNIAHLANALNNKELPRKRLKKAEDAIHRSMQLLRSLEQAVTSSGNRRGEIYDHSDSDEAIFDRLFRRTIRCTSTKALTTIDQLSGPTVLKLLSSSTALHLHRALREIHTNIVQAVNGEDERNAIITYVKRAHRLIRNGIYICACLADYGECRKLKFEPVDIEALIRACLKRYRSCFHLLPLKVDISGEVTLVRGNEKLLRKMVLEMIDYAARLKPTPDQLRITAERAAEDQNASPQADASNYIKIHFCYLNQFDLANSRHQLIHPYSQIARSQPQAAMGLAASIGIANRHGGSLTISSSKEGSVLSIKLPLASGLWNAFTGTRICHEKAARELC
jgi:hypothetical protein